MSSPNLKSIFLSQKNLCSVVVEYNLIIHKNQPQKLIFFIFYNFLINITFKPQPLPLKQTPSLYVLANV
jgi:hypothetical protein